MDRELVRNLEIRLLKGRTQRYLRYIHLRRAIASIADDIESICVCGAGHGVAEVLIGLEFPHIRWTLTDIIAKGYPNYHQAMDLTWQHNISDRFSFSIWNTLRPTNYKFDLVCSTEMLEHVPDDVRAARNMKAAALRYVYCMVPFADNFTNNDLCKRQDAWDRFEHFYCGYDKNMLEDLFGIGGKYYGAYWFEAGQVLRRTLSMMSDEDIENKYQELTAAANLDLIDALPTLTNQSAGISVLVSAAATLPAEQNRPPKIDEIGVIRSKESIK